MAIKELNLMCWKCRGIFAGINYLSKLLTEYKVSICALSEHWLRTFQLHVLNTINADYVSLSKGVDIYNPESMICKNRSGVGFLISKNIISFVTEIEIASDRIIGIEVSLPNTETFIILSLYLPATTQPLELFRYNIELLHEICSVYKEVGNIFLMGDLNTKISGPRYQFKPDERSRILSSLLEDYSLASVNVQLFCQGPIVTFQSYDGRPSTCIDHIIVPVSDMQHISRAKIIDNQTFSVSGDHPVFCSVAIKPLMTSSAGNAPPSVAWDRTRKYGYINDYSFALSHLLWNVEFPDGTINQFVIEDYYSKIVSSIQQAEHETLPYSVFRSHIKPYWNDNLSTLRDVMRSYRVDWISYCKFHDMKCELFYKYKKSKSEFREVLRAAFDEYESSIVKQIENDIDVDQKSMWTILIKRKQKPSMCKVLKHRVSLLQIVVKF